jgi:hypothetical protein
MDFGTLVVQFLFTGGAVGAWVVHKLDLQRFREEEKLRDKQEKRDALRQVMAVEQEMRDCLSSRGPTAQKKADELGSMVNKVHAMFFGDQELQVALKRITGAVTSSVGMTGHDFTTDYEGGLEVVRRRLKSFEDELSE